MRPPERVLIEDQEGNSVTLTATVKDSLDAEVSVTEHAVEAGANIIDHARPKLIALQLEGVVSDLSDGDGAAEDAFDFFLGLQQSPRVVQITTPRKFYEAMFMRKLMSPRRKEDGKGARFTLDFIESRTVNSRRTVVQVKLAKPAKKGKQPPQVRKPADDIDPLKAGVNEAQAAIKRGESTANVVGAGVRGVVGIQRTQ